MKDVTLDKLTGLATRKPEDAAEAMLATVRRIKANLQRQWDRDNGE